ncbi:DNA gyrase inhibitor YacG [soil metagenome]
MSTAGAPVVLRKRRPCPVCAKPSLQKYHPFCSARCAKVDLNRWLTGRYAIPAGEEAVPDPAQEKDDDDRGT